MYVSNPRTIIFDEKTKQQRTEAILRLYDLEFNVIPVNGKCPPCVEWKPYQRRRVTPEELLAWVRGRFARKGGGVWMAKNLNFALVTGEIPWSRHNPGVVVIDSDDDEAESQIAQRCPKTSMMQRTGSGGTHRLYRRPPITVFPYIPNRQKTVIDGREYNIDLRGDGGYILAPGSIHPKTGRLYQEQEPWTLELLQECPIYDPAWLSCERTGQTQQPRSSMPVTEHIEAAHHDLHIAGIDLAMRERERQARVYLDGVPGTRQGTGADRSCTSLTMRLVWGFALPAKTVLEILAEWGQKSDQLDDAGGWYPWQEAELARKIEWCLRQEYQGELGDRLHTSRDLGEMEAGVNRLVLPFEASAADEVVIDPKDQLGTATQFFKSEFSGTDLVHYHGTWYRWTGKRYEAIADDDIKARLWIWLASCAARKKGGQELYQPARNAVAGIMDALKAVTNQPSSLEMPGWLESSTLR